jgi:hypothetical protein
VLERRTAVKAQTGNAQNGELDRQLIAFLAARKVTGRLVNSNHFAIWKGGGIKARRLMRALLVLKSGRMPSSGRLLHTIRKFDLCEEPPKNP